MSEAGSRYFPEGEGIIRYFEICRLLILVFDREGKVRYINRRACEILGCEREEIEGFERAEKFIHPEDMELFRSAFNDLLCGRTGDSGKIKLRILTKHGDYRTILWDNHAIAGDTGDITEIISLGDDITERKNLETGFYLKSKVVETSINGIIISDMKANIIYANPSFARMHGYDSVDDVIGLNASEFFVDRIGMKEMFAEIMKTGSFFGNTTIRKKSGGIIIDQASVYLIRLEEEEEFYMVVSMVDITEKEKVKNALANANKRLNLLSGITRHDILNEVMIAAGYLDLYNDGTDDEKKEYVGKALTAINSIRKQAEFTRDYQDLGADSPEWQGPRKITENYLRSTSEYKGVDVVIDIGNVEIFADPMLPKVFANIMSNSLVHGEHVSVITVSSSEGPGGSLVITIEDNGVGIPADKKKSLFRPGVDTEHGFGLYLVKEILSITDIEITENGGEGKGARFDITVPPENWRNF